MKPPELPPARIMLGELLSDAQIDAVLDIIQTCPDSIDRVRKLKAYLSPFRDELEKKGLVVEYLAYLIEHLAVTHKPNYEKN